MKVLVLGLNYAPEQVGIGPYTRGLVEALAAAGHRVSVVTAKPYYPAWRTEAAFAGGGWRREQGLTASIVRCPIYVPARPNGARRILHHLSFAAAALLPALRAAAAKPQLVLVVAPSLLSVPVAWLAARSTGAALWVHIQDFEIDAAFATGLVSRRRWMMRAARRIEAALLRSADLVSTISPQMVRRLVDKGVAPARAIELRNWADDGFVPTEDGVDRYRADWRLGERHVALYSGNLATKQGVGILVEAARRLACRDDIAFVICGDGPNRAALAEAARGLGNVQLHPLQPAERMGDLLALASVHLLPQLPDAADLVLPSKLTNMLGSARPVVATAAPGTGLAEEVTGCGVVVPPGDAQAMAEAIESLVDDEGQRRSYGHAAATRAAERWSRVRILTRFVGTAEALAATRAPVAGNPECR